jgi:Ca-activated chloride channel family protein
MNVSSRMSLAVGLAVLAVAGAVPGVEASDGVLTGYVFDQAGSPLNGVAVEAVHEVPKGSRHRTHTNQDGAFRFAGLAAGRYRVSASAPKLKADTRSGVLVKPGGAATEITLMMEVPGYRNESAVIVEKAPIVSTTRPNVRESFDLESIESMPSTSRDQLHADLATAPSGPPSRFDPNFNTEAYAHQLDNPFLASRDDPLSTFSLDVDTASYANSRRFIQGGSLPPADAVRIEELVNYFPFSYPPPAGDAPLAVAFEVNACPWNPDARLVRIGVRAKDVPVHQRPPSNLVFLVDVSGSMTDENKLPLVKQSLRLLVEALDKRDRVAMVVYAGSSGLVLPSTPASDQQGILAAIDRLEAGGSTNGAQGIELAYQVASRHFIRGGNNRVLLATDGDFNVGVTSQGELVRLIEDKAKGGVFLTVLGFGMGNLKDATMEQLADRGNGNYAYVDSLSEARKVLNEQLAGTLLTVAKDVKLQVEMNPARVAVYRLIGYENRLLRKQDFNDDRKDAGDIGSGHTVTGLYEVVPTSRARGAPDLLTVKVRYKRPDGHVSTKLEWAVTDGGGQLATASPDFRFAAAVAAFGMLLRRSPHAGSASYDLVLSLAQNGPGAGPGKDRGGHRRGFIELVRQAQQIAALQSRL